MIQVPRIRGTGNGFASSRSTWCPKMGYLASLLVTCICLPIVSDFFLIIRKSECFKNFLIFETSAVVQIKSQVIKEWLFSQIANLLGFACLRISSPPDPRDWIIQSMHMEAYFFIYIKREPGQNRWDTTFLIGRHAT